MQNSRKPYAIERILSAGTYLTAGGVGFIWLIIAAIFKKQITPFLLYHIFQSIFISMLYFVVIKLAGFVYIILYRIPIINAIPYYINMPIPFIFGLSIVQTITTSVIIYLTITSFMGVYSYLPWISNIINTNTGRK